MKALKDCQWNIFIMKGNEFGTGFRWITFNDLSGLSSLSGLYRHTKTGAKKGWGQFAKLNKIKNWRYRNI